VISVARGTFLRNYLALAGVGLCVACHTPADLLRQIHPFRIGYLVEGTLGTSTPSLEAFRQGLQELEYSGEPGLHDGRADR
jgi:hypothetical protein